MDKHGFSGFQFAILTALFLMGMPVQSALADPVINEFVVNHTGEDMEAFVEVLGDPSTDYSGFTVLEIEGDSTSNEGTVDAVLPVGTTSAAGYWTDPEDMENGTLTILLVENFTGSVGDDLDVDDDGVIDDIATPWTRIVDDVAVSDGGGSDLTYSTTVLAPFFDGQPFSPGGASRIPDGTDTDATADWVRNDYDGFGLPALDPGTPEPGEAENTPNAENMAVSVSALTLVKVVSGGDAATTDWVLTADGTNNNDLSGAGGASGDVLPDTFALSESAGSAGYTAGDWVCVGGSQKDDSITLTIGQSSTCTITNTADPVASLTLTKTSDVATYSAIDDVINYSYLVTSSVAAVAGPITVADDMETVTCPHVNTVGNNDDILDPGEALTCTATHTVDQADIDATSITNKATASGDAGATVSNVDMLTVNYQSIFNDGFEG
jgi:hypothetical protein